MARLQASRSLSTKAIANAASIGLPVLYSDNRKGSFRTVPKYKSRKQVCALMEYSSHRMCPYSSAFR